MTVLILKTVNADMTSYNGFTWPEFGPIEAPDWNPESVCGGGLHGALWGEGDGFLFRWEKDAKWLVVEVLEEDLVDLRGKVKFPRGMVVHCGDRASATEYLARNGGTGRAIIGGTATAGGKGTATVGYGGTATAGDWGNATAGDYGTATAGYEGTTTAGYEGTLIIRWHDDRRYRVYVAYVGENGIKPNTPYRLNKRGEFEEVIS